MRINNSTDLIADALPLIAEDDGLPYGLDIEECLFTREQALRDLEEEEMAGMAA